MTQIKRIKNGITQIGILVGGCGGSLFWEIAPGDEKRRARNEDLPPFGDWREPRNDLGEQILVAGIP